MLPSSTWCRPGSSAFSIKANTVLVATSFRCCSAVAIGSADAGKARQAGLGVMHGISAICIVILGDKLLFSRCSYMVIHELILIRLGVLLEETTCTCCRPRIKPNRYLGS